MYNLLVSGGRETWVGEWFEIELSRCVREYTDEAVTDRYGELNRDQVAELVRLPCIFAYEAAWKMPPQFGFLKDIVRRHQAVRLRYEIVPLDPFVTAEQLEEHRFALDISNWEMNRTHWAVKDVNLPKELETIGIQLPGWASGRRSIDISKHHFDVAFSFPGEVRELVEQVAKDLERGLGPDTYFYDNNYVAQLARPGLDVLLQDLYRARSKLIVVFVGGNYQAKEWCGIEFRAIRDIIAKRENERIMFVRTDDGEVDGIFPQDGYVDARRFSPEQIAGFIAERAGLLS